jgi:hypothetical protein
MRGTASRVIRPGPMRGAQKHGAGTAGRCRAGAGLDGGQVCPTAVPLTSLAGESAEARLRCLQLTSFLPLS